MGRVFSQQLQSDYMSPVLQHGGIDRPAPGTGYAISECVGTDTEHYYAQFEGQLQGLDGKTREGSGGQ